MSIDVYKRQLSGTSINSLSPIYSALSAYTILNVSDNRWNLSGEYNPCLLYTSSSIEDNEFYDIAIKSVIDFETSNDELNLNDKEKILNAEMPTSMVDFDNTSELTIKNNLGG